MRLLLLIVLISPVLRASNIEPTVSEKIVDSHGKPVAGAVISAKWKLQGTGDFAVPYGPRAVTEASGHFSSLWIGSTNCRSAFMVYDSFRKEGAVVDMATADLGKPVVVSLERRCISRWRKRFLPLSIASPCALAGRHRLHRWERAARPRESLCMQQQV